MYAQAGLRLCSWVANTKLLDISLCGSNRESYMSAHVLLYLLNELGETDKIRGLLSILSLFLNEFNKFNILTHLAYRANGNKL